MSYQEERIQEITNAIRSVTGSSEKIKGTDIASEVGKLKNPSGTLLIEENGTFDVTNYANAEVDINIVTPSGIKTITENGDYDVTDYAWASVNVKNTAKAILGKWNITSGYYLEFDANGIAKFGFGTQTSSGTYTVNDVTISVNIAEADIVGDFVYDEDTDTITGTIFEEQLVLTRLVDIREKDVVGKWKHPNGAIVFELKPNGVGIYQSDYDCTYVIIGNTISIAVLGQTISLLYDEASDTMTSALEGVTLTRVQETANLITKEITENGTYTASDDGADGYSEVVVNVGGIKPFADATPEQIQQIGNEISAKGMTSAEVEEAYGWKIGDTKDITLTTGEVIQMRIMGFNHDNLTAGGKAGITLEMVNCLNTTYPMNSTETTVGGWGASQLRNTTLPTIKATLPSEWQNIIVKVDKKSANGGGSNFSGYITTSDDLFILSEIEIRNDGDSEEGVVYEYWSGKTNAHRIKKVNGTDSNWWTRSCPLDNKYRCIFRDGSTAAGTPTNSVGVSFAFCVGSSPAPVIAGLPIEATTDQEMTNALVEDNLGKVYKFTGTSDTYETDAIYIVSEVE